MASIWRLSILCSAQGGRGEVSWQPEVLNAASSRGRGCGRIRILGGEPSGPGNSYSFGRSGFCRNHSSDHRCLRAAIFTRARVASALDRRDFLKKTPSGSYSLLRQL